MPGEPPRNVPLAIQTGVDLARLALRMLEFAGPEFDPQGQAAIDLGAAALAVHICDWHHLPADATNERKRTFAKQFPDWCILRDVVNGVNYPHSKGHFLDRGQIRSLEWEDADFWFGGHRGSTVVVVHDSEERAIRALVVAFCQEYIALHGSGSAD